MRTVLFGLLAATGALCAACTPPVGSPEWCKQMQENPPKDMASVTPEMMQGAQKCAMDAINGMMQSGKPPGQ